MPVTREEIRLALEGKLELVRDSGDSPFIECQERKVIAICGSYVVFTKPGQTAAEADTIPLYQAENWWSVKPDPTRFVWINVYDKIPVGANFFKRGSLFISSLAVPHQTREAADRSAAIRSNRVGCIKVEITDRFDD